MEGSLFVGKLSKGFVEVVVMDSCGGRPVHAGEDDRSGFLGSF